MTNTEAITKLTNIMHDDHYSWSPPILTAFGMAVDALRGADGDSISRQAVKDALTDTSLLEWEQLKKCFPMLEVVDEVPSTQPEHFREVTKKMDVISRQGLKESLLSEDYEAHDYCFPCKEIMKRIDEQPSAQPEQRWIPIKVRPMDAEERKEWSEKIGYDIEDEEAFMFDCLMPDDEQEVWVCSKCGNVWQDTCQIDEGIYLEGNGDWIDIVAWMPFNKPEPYRKEGEV